MVRSAKVLRVNGTGLSAFSQDDFDEIAWLLNTRPRKSPNWRYLAELFTPDETDFQCNFE